MADLAEARSVQAGQASRYAVKRLDTDLNRLGTQCHLFGNVILNIHEGKNITYLSQGRAQGIHRVAEQ